MALAALGSLTDELIATVAKISPEQKVIHLHIMIGRSLLIACSRTLRAFRASSAEWKLHYVRVLMDESTNLKWLAS